MSEVDPPDDDDDEGELDLPTWPQQAVGRPFIWMRASSIDLTEENPFLTIWTRPRQTIRAIVETDPTRHVLILTVLQGIALALMRASTQKLGDHFTFPAVLAMVVGLGSLVGLAALYGVAWILALTGRWLGGRAQPERFRAAIAWSSVPMVASLPPGLMLFAVLGRELFMTRTPTIDAYPALGLLVLGWQGITALLRGWELMLFVRCTEEVQDFSVWRGLGSLLLAGLVVAVVVLLTIVIYVSAR
jgi:Yip1 domain